MDNSNLFLVGILFLMLNVYSLKNYFIKSDEEKVQEARDSIAFCEKFMGQKTTTRFVITVAVVWYGIYAAFYSLGFVVFASNDILKYFSALMIAIPLINLCWWSGRQSLGTRI